MSHIFGIIVEMNDIRDFINEKKKKGFRVSYSVDIRKVENLFKKIFGAFKKSKKKRDKEEKHEKKRKRSTR